MTPMIDLPLRSVIELTLSCQYPTSNPQQSSWPLPPALMQQKDTEMSGLDALVAVATREETSAAAPNA